MNQEAVFAALQNAALAVIAVLLFGLIVFVHEFGHFITAKWAGIRVNEFAVGMGPAVFKFRPKNSETQYTLRLFPIGGFCAMEGEDSESEDSAAFGNKPVWKRILVVSAGAVMNVLTGIVLMIVVLAQEPVFTSTTIAQFTENSAFEAAGLQVGDQFYSVNGYRTYVDRDFSYAMATADPESVDITVVRDGQKLEFQDVRLTTKESAGGEVIVFDFYVAPVEKNLGTLLGRACTETVSVVRLVWSSLVGLVTGQYGFRDLSGPVGAANALSQVASIGLQTGFLTALNNILSIMIVIVVNLGIVNLLPLPALDGGRLVFLILEGIRRKPVNPKYEGWVHAAGFALIIGLMVAVTFSDILRLFSGGTGG